MGIRKNSKILLHREAISFARTGEAGKSEPEINCTPSPEDGRTLKENPMRMTKLMAAMLVITCAMTMVPQKAEASIFGSLINLTENEYDPAVIFHNYTRRDVRFRVADCWGQVHKTTMKAGEGAKVAITSSPYVWIEASVWNANKGKWIVMDYIDVDWGHGIQFYKYARGDFRLETTASWTEEYLLNYPRYLR